MIAWESKSEQETIDAGRDPSLIKDGELWPDKIIEVERVVNHIEKWPEAHFCHQHMES